MYIKIGIAVAVVVIVAVVALVVYALTISGQSSEFDEE